MKLADAGQLMLMEAASRHLSPKTIRFYRQRLTAIERAIGNKKVEEITIHDLRLVLASSTPRSVRHNYATIKRLFNFLVNEDILRMSVASKLAPPKVPVHVVQPLSGEEIQNIYRQARGRGGYLGLRDAAIFATLVGLGLRNAELCGLRDEDVQLKAGYALVRGKGNKDRLVPIPSKLRMALAKYQFARNDLTTANKCDFFFRSVKGNRLDTHYLGELMTRLGKQANVKLWAHRCRHTFATLYMSNDGSDVLALQAICGWSSLAMANRYAKVSFKKLERSMEAFSPANCT